MLILFGIILNSGTFATLLARNESNYRGLKNNTTTTTLDYYNTTMHINPQTIN